MTSYRLTIVSLWIAATFFVGTPSAAFSQPLPSTVTVRVAAPIFLYPDQGRQPLVVAKEGSLLRVVGEQGDWYQVEFRDPALGPRQGFIQKRNVTSPTPPTAPASAVSEPPAPERPSPPTRAPSSISARTPPLARESQQRWGDVAVGYGALRADNLSLPRGIAASVAMRVGSNADLVAEGQYARGTFDFLGADDEELWTVMGGVRLWPGSTNNPLSHVFGQLLAGMVGANVSVDFNYDLGVPGNIQILNGSAFALQPGVGVELPTSRTVAIRPQFDVLISRLHEQTGEDLRFSVNVVVRLFR